MIFYNPHVSNQAPSKPASPDPAKKSPAPSRLLWSKFPLKTGHRWLNLLLLFVPAAIVLDLLHASPLLIFIASALAIAPLASVLGESTGVLAAYSGPAVGGILSATMGNATEMIIAFFALHAGHINVVKASLSGSIIGNLLLVLGLSLVAGGIRNPVQRFARNTSAMNSTMLMIAVAALVMPAVFNLTIFGTLQHRDVNLVREHFGDYQRQLFLVDHAGLPLKTVLDQLDLLGEEVVPVLRKEIAARQDPQTPDAPTHASLVRAKYGDEAPRQPRPNANRGDNVTGASPYQDSADEYRAEYPDL